MRRALLPLIVAACGDNRSVVGAEPPPVAIEPDAQHEPPTYYRDVAPILSARCAGCHGEGKLAPFALTSFADASLYAPAIAEVTATRRMPPWPADASGACGTFVDPRWLSDRELAILAAWNDAGAPSGDPGDLQLAAAPALEPFAPSITLIPETAYPVRPGPDEYRCFVIDPALAEDRYITALAMQLDRAEVVHHVQLFAATGALGERSIDERDAADAGPGYACDDDVGRGLAYVGVWAGGDLVRRWPEGSGIRIAAGHRLVLQLHYHNHGSEPVADRSGIALELASSVAHVGRITSAQATSFELPPQPSPVSISATMPLPIAGPEAIRAARIHMHRLGTSARMELVRDGNATCLLDIPRWDVGWQLFYRFAEPIEVKPNDQIRIRCTYDTSSLSEPVVWGNGTEDEMCIAYTLVAP